jgi:acyl-homoserine-lactone acylase
LQAAGFPLDATLAELQFSVRDPLHTALHGGTNYEGVENVVEVGTLGLKTSLEPEPLIGPLVDGSYSLTADGYPIAFGSSFLLAMEFTDSGPRASTILTYSESGDSSSPHYADQGELFSRKQWKAVAFTEAEIMADPALETTTVIGVRP